MCIIGVAQRGPSYRPSQRIVQKPDERKRSIQRNTAECQREKGMDSVIEPQLLRVGGSWPRTLNEREEACPILTPLWPTLLHLLRHPLLPHQIRNPSAPAYTVASCSSASCSSIAAAVSDYAEAALANAAATVDSCRNYSAALFQPLEITRRRKRRVRFHVCARFYPLGITCRRKRRAPFHVCAHFYLTWRNLIRRLCCAGGLFEGSSRGHRRLRTQFPSTDETRAATTISVRPLTLVLGSKPNEGLHFPLRSSISPRFFPPAESSFRWFPS